MDAHRLEVQLSAVLCRYDGLAHLEDRPNKQAARDHLAEPRRNLKGCRNFLSCLILDLIEVLNVLQVEVDAKDDGRHGIKHNAEPP